MLEEISIMKRITLCTLFVVIVCATCFAQTTYNGLTPGKSTRADAERVLGQPVPSVSKSKTLIEYKAPGNVGKLYTQYRDDSSAATVERIELLCTVKGQNGCFEVYDKFVQTGPEVKPLMDARKTSGPDSSGRIKEIIYFAS